MTAIETQLLQRLQKLPPSGEEIELSQTEVGQLAELHYTHIGRFERGKLLDAFMVKKQLQAMARDGRAQR